MNTLRSRQRRYPKWRTIRKMMGGGEFFSPIACAGFFCSCITFLFLARIFSCPFTLHDFFWLFLHPPPPPPHHFSTGPSLGKDALQNLNQDLRPVSAISFSRIRKCIQQVVPSVWWQSSLSYLSRIRLKDSHEDKWVYRVRSDQPCVSKMCRCEEWWC